MPTAFEWVGIAMLVKISLRKSRFHFVGDTLPSTQNVKILMQEGVLIFCNNGKSNNSVLT